MRTKDDILSTSLKVLTKDHEWDTVASTHERLTIEVLCDIRDVLVMLNATAIRYLELAEAIRRDFNELRKQGNTTQQPNLTRKLGRARDIISYLFH